MKILNAMWFTAAHGCVGIVQAETEFEGLQYYIGPARGYDEEVDKQEIVDWGARFPFMVGEFLFNG